MHDANGGARAGDRPIDVALEFGEARFHPLSDQVELGRDLALGLHHDRCRSTGSAAAVAATVSSDFELGESAANRLAADPHRRSFSPDLDQLAVPVVESVPNGGTDLELRGPELRIRRGGREQLGASAEGSCGRFRQRRSGWR